METMTSRVERGVAWLDAQQPGWAHRIDLAEFDFSDCSSCVIGQLFGWEEGQRRLGAASRPETRIKMAEHGFDARSDDRNEAMDELHFAWRRVIFDRQSGATP